MSERQTHEACTDFILVKGNDIKARAEQLAVWLKPDSVPGSNSQSSSSWNPGSWNLGNKAGVALGSLAPPCVWFVTHGSPFKCLHCLRRVCSELASFLLAMVSASEEVLGKLLQRINECGAQHGIH